MTDISVDLRFPRGSLLMMAANDLHRHLDHSMIVELITRRPRDDEYRRSKIDTPVSDIRDPRSIIPSRRDIYVLFHSKRM